MVFLISNLRRIRSVSSSSARISSRIFSRPSASSGSAAGELLFGVRGGRVDHGARGQDEAHAGHGRVGVELRAALHAAGVVGDHTADRGDLHRGGVGSELATVGCENPVDVGHHRARGDRDRAALVEHLDAAEVAAHIDQDAIALALAVEARAAGTEGDADPVLASEGDHLADVLVGLRHDHRPGQLSVRAGVGGVTDDVAGPAEHPVCSECLDQLRAQRLRCAFGHPVRSAVRRGLARLRCDLERVGLEQWHLCFSSVV